MAREEPADEAPRRRISPFTMMVASLGGAAAVGAMLGAIIASGIAKPTPVATGPKVGIEEINALKEQVVQARVELAALKSSFDAGHRSANQQFTKISERVERMERVQADPVAKLTKAVESLERVRRAEAAAAATAAHPPEVTGTIPAAQAAPPQAAAGKAGVVDGWVLRDVHRGTAFIEGRMGIIEVDQGDMVPGLGRVDAIRKQDGRWVVVTSKGLIVPPK
jgi:Asp-tRNA(Asn)/Glu-tRNA(Gln) amidotransferase C subunit